MKRAFYFMPLLLLFFSCKEEALAVEDNTPVDVGSFTGEFASDYFVFIADDQSDPLVIPMDFNWRTFTEGYEIEFKSWYGTRQEWPIRYLKMPVASSTVPSELFEHEDREGFQFDSVAKKVTLDVPNSPEIRVFLPDIDAWVEAPSSDPESFSTTSAARTCVEVMGESKEGWLLYERIRAVRNVTPGSSRDFGAFFWMPVVLDNKLYHFIEHRGEQEAYKWTFMNDDVVVNNLKSFHFEITATEKDEISSRDSIPMQVEIGYTLDNLRLTLQSQGSQVGYGAMFPNGLAYYRQSLLISTPDSQSKGYGMMELILEDD